MNRDVEQQGPRSGFRGGDADRVVVGLERCLACPPDILRCARFGLLMNPAAVDREFRYAHRLLAARFPGQLRALFGPQHGFWGQQQDNMIETPHSVDPDLGVPVYSLYSEHRRPTAEMLADLDCLVIDLQDVGTRVYTYTWTMHYCLEACAAGGVSVLVLDRPNPLGGQRCEGPLLNPDYRSFVGRAAVPMRHGLTIAELARHLNRVFGLRADLHVVPLEGWSRRQHWAATDRVWVSPSPNLPRIEGVDVYPGQVLWEGTELSEGRGTTTPFEVCGAPFVDPARLLAALGEFQLEGVTCRPVGFEPTFQKWAGVSCRGLCLHVTDRGRFAPYYTTLALLACVHRLWPDSFQWRLPPYEYETRLWPIDILTGGAAVREAINGDAPAETIRALAETDDTWWPSVAEDLLYRTDPG